MRSKLGTCLAVLALTVGANAAAEIGTMDIVPSATLLLPYFEADAETGESSPGKDTRFIIRNTGPAPAIAHMVLYTDFGVPTVTHDIYLTGYDVERFSLYEIFAENSLSLAEDTPITGTPPAGPTDTALFTDGFESGDLSGWTTFQSDVSVDTLRAYHTGTAAPREDNCAGSSVGDGVARGYVTLDSTSQFSTAFPSAAGYFIDGGLGIANNENVLTGEFEIRDIANNFASGNPLVHIEADDTADTGTPGEYTFYSRYTDATAADNREPLGTNYAVRHASGGAFDGGTALYYWRDVKIDQGPFVCGTAPTWFPLNINIITEYDESGISTFPFLTVTPFGLACGRTQVGTFDFAPNFSFGFFEIDFNSVFQGEFNVTNQAVVFSSTTIEGRIDIGLRALPLDNALDLTP